MKRTVLLLTALLTTPAFAAQPTACSAFQMDVSAELELFQSAPATIEAAGNEAAARQIEVGRLYQVALQRQSRVQFAATPKRAPDPVQAGGMLRIVIAEAGAYRVAVNAPAWIDAVFAGQPLHTSDFRSDRACPGPTKIVTFNLPAGAELLLQFVDVDRPALRLAVTPAPAEVW